MPTTLTKPRTRRIASKYIRHLPPKQFDYSYLSDILGACGSQHTMFEQTFPVGCKLTARSVRKAVKAGLRVRWFIFKIFRVWDCHSLGKQMDAIDTEYYRSIKMDTPTAERIKLDNRRSRRHGELIIKALNLK